MSTFTLQQLDLIGELAYIAKHNSNYSQLQATIRTILDSLTTPGSTLGIQTALRATYGSETTLVEEGSYVVTAGGGLPAEQIAVAAGFCWAWDGAQGSMVESISAQILSFAGQPAATYFVDVSNTTGLPAIASSQGLQSIYSVVWSGAAVGAITRLAPISWGYAGFLAAQISSAFGETFTSLDERLEVGENAMSAGRTDSLAAADVTLTQAQFIENVQFKLTGVLGVDRNLVVPNQAKLFVVRNTCTGGKTVTVGTAASPVVGVLLNDGDVALIYCDGVDCVTVAATLAEEAHAYDVGGTLSGAPTASQILPRYPFPRQVTFPAGLTDSQGVAATGATAQADFDIKRDGVSVGTMRFDPAVGAGKIATFIMATETVFTPGQVLTIVAPGSPDATLADIGFALAGVR